MTAGLPDAGYVGRFAPSPTGPLHFGSLLAAAASYLDARAQRGKWLLRIEDIDPPRACPDADREIIRALESYGFAWDGDVYYQSRRDGQHRDIVRALVESARAYPCSCSRQDLADCPRGPLGTIYPGHCRKGCRSGDVAIRIRTDKHPVAFVDRWQGPQSQSLEAESGDFVILRRDGWISYQLAVVADDFDQGVTDVVRGIDLLDSTPRQVYLQRLLGYPTPQYAHLPIVRNADGLKLGKSSNAPAVPVDEIRPTLLAVLAALGQSPVPELAACRPETIWAWAVDHWDGEALVGRRALAAPASAVASG